NSYSLFFFIPLSTHPRDLHSFPTRRSSDLPSALPGFQGRKPPLFGILHQLRLQRQMPVLLQPDPAASRGGARPAPGGPGPPRGRDRKSTRLNSSHLVISYAVFCLKKKTNK